MVFSEGPARLMPAAATGCGLPPHWSSRSALGFLRAVGAVELQEELPAVADSVHVHVLEVVHRQVAQRVVLDLVERKVGNVVLHLSLPQNLCGIREQGGDKAV